VSTLSGVLPRDQYGPVLRRILAPIETYWHEHDVPDMPVYLFIGAAGFAAPTRQSFNDVIFETIPGFLKGNIRAAGISNDTAALLWGYDADGAVIAGTGSNVLVRSRSGELFQAGGHDWVATDYGAGFWVGLRAIRQVARDLESGESTVLLDRFSEMYGIFDGQESDIIARFRTLAVSDSRLKADIARFATAVCAAAERGDLDAQNIVKSEAEDLADSIARTIRRRFTKDEVADGLTLVQCGSLLSNSFYRAAFEAQTRMRLAQGAEGDGGITWHRTNNGLQATMNLAQRLTGDVDDLLQTSPSFRPAIVRF
jgi:N-acetylglucosamine kinase-like BadF-type ATPase